MKKEYVIYQNAEGQTTAHTDTYEAKDGEKEVGRVEANSVQQAEKQYAKQQKQAGKTGGADADEGTRETESPEEAAERLREEEEAKEDFEVLADENGDPYVAGGESDTEAPKAKATAAPPQNEESSLGTFRAKDEQEALDKATGKYKDPAEGHPRGSQTP